jgi:hypothetical protein
MLWSTSLSTYPALTSENKPLSGVTTIFNTMKKPAGLYANIHAKKARIEAGSGETMRKPGTKGAPTAKAFKESAKTAKKK